MLVTEIDNRTFVEDITARLSKERTGIHLSDLDLCLKASYYRRLNPQPLSPKQAVMFSIGLGVQEYLYPQAEQTYELDGILCSPDARNVEVKTVRSQLRTFDPANYPHWLWRIGGYCKVLGTLTYTLDVIFVIAAVARSWRLEYSQQEVDTIWAEAKMRRDILVRAWETGVPPSPDFHPDWLCDKCEHAGECWAKGG